MAPHCSAPDCPNPVKAKGLCATHYMRLRRTGSIDLPPQPEPAICSESGCDSAVKAQGRCPAHYQAWRAEQAVFGECSAAGCPEPAIVRGGTCRKHYMRIRRKGNASDERKNAAAPCAHDGCPRKARAHGLCDSHWYGMRYAERSEARRGVCLVCGGPLPPGRTLYCSDEHYNFAKPFQRSLHGASLDQYMALLRAQGGRCAICGTTEPGGRGRFHVDHDHDVGTTRGLLCNDHNHGLGLFGDDPALLRAAADYIERHRPA